LTRSLGYDRCARRVRGSVKCAGARPVGEPINQQNPDGKVRVLLFGAAGLVTYLILEDQRQVDVLDVIWAQ
jgi:hypothetical protein